MFMASSVQVHVNLRSSAIVRHVDTHDRLTIGEVARRSGFAASAIRYYEDQGLLEAGRTSGGRRTFERSVLRRLAFIRAAGNVGLTLEEIRGELAGLPANRTPTKADWLRISRHWRGRLDEQIAALERLRDGLDSCIGCGCLSMKRCGISNPGDVAARSGAAPGAAYLPRLLRRNLPHASRR
jgi:MerR family redox-sensitive transcriptional activator SoxR